jgi:carbon storage regulator CsrA
MLVLSRKANQGIWIGDNIFVTILRIEGGRVKIGIEAPADVRVDRDEVRTADTAVTSS